jgi:AcrR family transcriptional regulator
LAESEISAPAADVEMPAFQQRRRQRIVRAALELLEDGDYDTIQMRDVAQRSEFAIGTIYRYFSSKEHLYAAVMVEWANSFLNNLRRQPLKGDPPDRLKEVVGRVVRAFEHRGQFLRLEIVLETSVDEDVVAIFYQVAQRHLAGFLEALPGIDRDIADSVLLVVTSVMSAQLQQYALGRNSIDTVYEQTCKAIDLVFSTVPLWNEADDSPAPPPPKPTGARSRPNT